jgi:SAM-dependent methyltransferase
MKNLLKKWLAEPLARGLDLDDPALFEVRKYILRKKKFLRAIYAEWYQLLSDNVSEEPGIVLELGSGSGYARESIPNLLSSEIVWIPDVSMVIDGCALPFSDHSVKAIVMTDVLHHIPQVRAFFSEAMRCLVPHGVVVMIEPWVSPWSIFIYKYFHHEQFDPDSAAWEFETSGPLSGANGALPWMIFERDKSVFNAEFPLLSVETITPMMPFCYLLSGGLSVRGILPGFTYPWCRSFERLLDPWSEKLGMFAFIVLRRANYS